MRWTVTLLGAVALAGPAASAPPAAAQALTDVPVLVLDHGAVQRHLDRLDAASASAEPGRVGADARPAASAAAAVPAPTRVTFAAGLDALLAGGAIDRATRDADRKILLDARRSWGRISGTRHTELGAVLRNLDQIAGAGGLTPSRLPGLVLTLRRNREWWTTGPLLGDRQRIGFAGSQLVWQYYAGQGVQIQWLGTFGKANGYFLGGRGHDAELGALLDEAIGLATERAGGIAWEYDFHFDGGAPPWVSALAEGTAVQSLGRAAVRLGRPDYFTAGTAGLGVFSAPPPAGVRVATPSGARYLIYSFAPGENVINAFVQSLVGLHDYAGLANSDAVRALFAAGEAQARLDVPHYDTGAWSLYDQSTESDLGYHVLLRDFLDNLCGRLR
ncbi:MAG: D-glucuronyl C5-epimerase family protein, partial [Actinobacteria bacterium]|nr:D-glucuronyl C5-epimerase family protein [Actinomycetota bacterium]